MEGVENKTFQLVSDFFRYRSCLQPLLSVTKVVWLIDRDLATEINATLRVVAQARLDIVLPASQNVQESSRAQETPGGRVRATKATTGRIRRLEGEEETEFTRAANGWRKRSEAKRQSQEARVIFTFAPPRVFAQCCCSFSQKSPASSIFFVLITCSSQRSGDTVCHGLQFHDRFFRAS